MSAEETIINILKGNVPSNLVTDIDGELKKEFVLSKRKSKEQKQKKKNKKHKYITRKDKKRLNFFNIPRTGLKYANFISMRNMWKDYMINLLQLSDSKIPAVHEKNWDSFTQTIYKSDIHGSHIKVVRSKCPNYVDKEGICIMDTKNTLKIISKNDIVTTIPKKECVFEFYLNNITITIFGKHLCIRPAERSVKKMKCLLMPDL